MKSYNILHLEDSKTDANLVKRIINNAGITCNIFLVNTKEEYIQGLEDFKPDLILSDHTLPMFNSKVAYGIAREKYPDIPFLLVTRSVSEEFAVEMIKNGIDDYLLKSNLNKLPIAINNAFTKRGNEERIRAMRQELQQSEANMRSIINNTATGLLLLNQTGIILELNKQTNYFAKLALNKHLKKTDNLLDQLPENRKQDFKEKLAIVLKGESVAYCTSYLQDNGKNILFKVRLFPVTDRLGEITGVAVNFENVTQQKDAEIKLRESEILNRSILTSIRSHIAVVDETGLILEVNEAWTNFSKNNGETVLKRTGKGRNYIEVCRKAVASGDIIAKKVLHGFSQVSKNEIPFFELVYPCHSQKEERWFQLVITKFVGDSNKVVMTHIDISQLKKANKEAADFKNALNQSSLVDISDRNGIIQSVNENFCSISKYSKEELIGQDHQILNSGFHPKELFSNLWNTIMAGKIWRSEVRNKAKDGSFFWLDTTIVPFLDNDGKPFQFITIRSDITEKMNANINLRESEKRYSDLFHLSPQPMWIVDLETFHFLDVNEAAVAKYMYSREEFMRMNTNDIISSLNEDALNEENFKLKHQEQMYNKNKIFKHYKKNGEMMLVNIACDFITYKTKKAELVLATDVTEKMKYIAAIEQQNKQLQEIAWTQSHIVRAPLARMMGIANLIADYKMVPAELSEWLASFKNSANELDKIIKDITKKTKKIN